MSASQLDQIIQSAIAAGILPVEATLPAENIRPWPVILLTALGAWLAAIPLLAVFFLSMGGILSKGAGPYFVGVLALAGSVAVLRKEDLSLFKEQLSVPALLVGGWTLGIGLFRDVPDKLAAALLAMLAVAVACAIARDWLRILLGGAACAMAMLVFVANGRRLDSVLWWLALHAAVLGWVGAQVAAPRLPVSPVGARQARILEYIAMGWILVALAGLAIFSGMTFLAGASLRVQGGSAGMIAAPWTKFAQAGSLALAGAAAAWLARCWPSCRTIGNTLGAIVLLALSWLMPSLGAVILVLALAAAGARWRLAMTAGLAAAWIIGAFYYQVHFPLATKALILVAAGALPGAVAWIALRGGGNALLPVAAAPDSLRSRLAIALCAASVLAVANVGIWKKETLIAKGRPIFIEIAPVDPRSLMQGDYMPLAFRLPEGVRSNSLDRAGAPPIRVVGKVDGRGVTSLIRIDRGTPLAADEISMELTPRRFGWTLVTDAWYFKEGEANRWSRARYGEFRVDASGRALLVGLRGPALEGL